MTDSKDSNLNLVVEQLQADNETLRQENEQSNARLVELAKDKKTLSDRFSELETDLVILGRARDRDHYTIRRLESKIAELTARLGDAQQLKDNARVDFDRIVKQLRSTEAHVKKLESENARMSSDLQDKVRELDQSKGTTSQLNSKLTEEVQRGTKKKDEIVRLCGVVKGLEQDVKRLKSAAPIGSAATPTPPQQAEQLEPEVGEQMRSLTLEVTSLGQKLKESEEKCSALEKERTEEVVGGKAPEKPDEEVEGRDAAPKGKKKRRPRHKRATGAKAGPEDENVEAQLELTETAIQPVPISDEGMQMQPETSPPATQPIQMADESTQTESGPTSHQATQTQPAPASPAPQPIQMADNSAQVQSEPTSDQSTQTQPEPTPETREQSTQTTTVPFSLPSRPSKIATVAIVLLIIACLVAIGWSAWTTILAVKERNMWIACNDMSRRAATYLMEGKSGGTRLGWPWEEGLLKLDEIPVNRFMERRSRYGQLY